MRMRLKSNLDERFNSCSDYLIAIDKSQLDARIANKTSTFIDFEKVFNNNNKVYIDLGCGKGSFAIELAKRCPDVNVIAIEMITNVIIGGLERMKELNLPNLKFLNTGADYLPKYFREKSVDRIYLNFSTPKQKKTYANSRLTSPRFLAFYNDILAVDGEIHQKTDDDDFFAYSLVSFKENGYLVKDVTYDLHETENPDNIITEYESQFITLGKKIKRLVAYKG